MIATDASLGQFLYLDEKFIKHGHNLLYIYVVYRLVTNAVAFIARSGHKWVFVRALLTSFDEE